MDRAVLSLSVANWSLKTYVPGVLDCEVERGQRMLLQRGSQVCIVGFFRMTDAMLPTYASRAIWIDCRAYRDSPVLGAEQ